MSDSSTDDRDRDAHEMAHGTPDAVARFKLLEQRVKAGDVIAKEEMMLASLLGDFGVDARRRVEAMVISQAVEVLRRRVRREE